MTNIDEFRTDTVARPDAAERVLVHCMGGHVVCALFAAETTPHELVRAVGSPWVPAPGRGAFHIRDARTGRRLGPHMTLREQGIADGDHIEIAQPR